jgi:hypothetical protein
MARHEARLRVIAFHLGVQPNGEEITMSAFERLLAIADEETLDVAHAMIGKPEVALVVAKEALKNTTEVLSNHCRRSPRNFPKWRDQQDRKLRHL